MLTVWFPLSITFFMLAVLTAVAGARGQSMTKPERERLFFRQTYGLSIDRMLSESPLDRELRSLSRTYFSPKRLLTDTSRLEDNAVLDQQVRPR